MLQKLWRHFFGKKWVKHITLVLDIEYFVTCLKTTKTIILMLKPLRLFIKTCTSYLIVCFVNNNKKLYAEICTAKPQTYIILMLINWAKVLKCSVGKLTNKHSAWPPMYTLMYPCFKLQELAYSGISVCYRTLVTFNKPQFLFVS